MTTYAMTHDLYAKWLAALRSGDYRQGACSLKTFDGSYCCLGVLVHVALDGAPSLIIDGCACRETSTHIEIHSPVEGATVRATLPPVFDTRTQVLFGLTVNQMEELIKLNDGALADGAKTFAQIADWIEANIKPADAA